MKEEDEIVVLQEFEFLSDADTLKGMLESNGIPAMVTDRLNPYGTIYSRPKVRVFARDLEAARRLMADTLDEDTLADMAMNARADD